MTDADRQRLRATFTEDAELYARRRSGYPAATMHDLAALGALRPGSRVLEIGCGAGQATLPLARLGCKITAVELGPELAAVARDRLAGFDNTEVVVANFEDWPLPRPGFDLVLAATSFHWIDPAIRMKKSADALRPNGALAVISTHHVAGGTNTFFVDVQACYECFDPTTPPGLRLQRPEDIPADIVEFEESGRFGPVTVRRYQWEMAYTAGEYLELLSTYSGHRAMTAQSRKGLFACIKRLIDDHGGTIVKRYMTQLAIAHRLR